MIIVLLSSVLLAGCDQIHSDDFDKLTAPDVRNYDQELLDKAADEMESGVAPTLNILVVDYGIMRDQSRVLKGENVDIDR